MIWNLHILQWINLILIVLYLVRHLSIIQIVHAAIVYLPLMLFLVRIFRYILLHNYITEKRELYLHCETCNLKGTCTYVNEFNIKSSLCTYISFNIFTFYYGSKLDPIIWTQELFILNYIYFRVLNYSDKVPILKYSHLYIIDYVSFVITCVGTLWDIFINFFQS